MSGRDWKLFWQLVTLCRIQAQLTTRFDGAKRRDIITAVDQCSSTLGRIAEVAWQLEERYPLKASKSCEHWVENSLEAAGLPVWHPLYPDFRSKWQRLADLVGDLRNGGPAAQVLIHRFVLAMEEMKKQKAA